MNNKEDLVRHYHWLRQYAYNDSHSGNASVKTGNTFWVTPTGCCADTLQASDLVSCRLDSPPASGASLDAALHQAVYQKNPNAQAILHSHGAYSVAVTLNGDDFYPADFEGQHYFKRVPVVSIDYDKYLELAADAVSNILAQYPVTVVRGHGVYVCAETLNLAYKWTCSLELSAKTYLLARQANTLF